LIYQSLINTIIIPRYPRPNIQLNLGKLFEQKILPLQQFLDDFNAWKVKYILDNRYIICSGNGGKRKWGILSKQETVQSLPFGTVRDFSR
jgi:hypothetical protein